jgi:hypothetical protein
MKKRILESAVEDINYLELQNILTKKINRGILKLNEIQISSPEFHELLDQIMHAIEAIKKAKKFDPVCKYCLDEMIQDKRLVGQKFEDNENE